MLITRDINSQKIHSINIDKTITKKAPLMILSWAFLVTEYL
jgi:hypothetical protein